MIDDGRSDHERIGARSLMVLARGGRFFFERDGARYDMAPAAITDYAMDPLVLGADRMVILGAKLKGWEGRQSFQVLYSESYLPMADVLLSLKEPRFNGWIYTVEPVNLQGFMPGQCAWVCPYMGLFFNEPPKALYLKMELSDDS